MYLTIACFLYGYLAYSQNGTLRGKVTDVSQTPLIGVNVVEKGTTNGTITDINGNYTLSAPSGATIIFSYIGFATQEVQWDGKSVLNMILQEDTELLDESGSSRIRNFKESKPDRGCRTGNQ